MASVEKILAKARKGPKNISFSDLCKVCEFYFGEPHQKGSHTIYSMPWSGDPRVNLQNVKGQAKEYQVIQVLKAIDKLEDNDGR